MRPDRNSVPSFPGLGVRVYGAAGIALGLIGLVWGDFATVWQPIQALPFAVPHRAALAYTVAAGLVAAGTATQWRRTERAGVAVLACVYLGFALLWLPRVVGYPRVVGTWAGFAEQFALVAAGAVALARSSRGDAARARSIERAARWAFGACAIAFGLQHLTALPQTAAMVPHWIPPGQTFWAVATGVAHLLAGIAIVAGVFAAVAARSLTLMLAGFGALVWAPSLAAAPRDHIVWAGNATNLAVMGAAWIIAGALSTRPPLSRRP